MKIISENRQIINLEQSETYFNMSYVFLEGELRIIRHKQGQAKGRKGGRQEMSLEKHITEERKELYRYQARNRAGQNVYRLVHENNLKKMWTLTYAEEITDRKHALSDFKLFMKRLNYHQDRKIKYVAVVEVQKKRAEITKKDVLHFHVAMEDFYIKKEKLQEMWGHGNVWFSTYKDGGKIEKNKTAVATYMSKYLKKDMEDNPQLAGKKMYLNSQGLKRPPTGSGIIDEKKFNLLDKICHTYDIKGQENMRGYNLKTENWPNELDIGKFAEAIS